MSKKQKRSSAKSESYSSYINESPNLEVQGGAGAYSRSSWTPPEGKKKKKSKGKKVATVIFCIILALILAVVAAAVVYINSLNSKIQTVDDELAAALDIESSTDDDGTLTATTTDDSAFYVLVLGSDTRSDDTDGSRSDTIMLVRVDTDTKAVTIISIPRDTQVYIEGYGTSKINAAYAYGGAALAVTTVEELAGVQISHVVEVDFSGFEDIVDALGGVYVYVPANTEYDGIVLEEGYQTLDGEEALVLARCRKTYATGDYQRTENQRNLVIAIIDGIMDTSIVNLPSVINSICDAVTTDMSVTEILSLAISMYGMDTDEIMTAVAPSYTGTENGVSYVYLYEDEWEEMMARVDAGLDPEGDE